MDEVIESSPNNTRNCSYREKYERKRFERSQKIRKIRNKNSKKEEIDLPENNFNAPYDEDLSSLGCSVIQIEPEEQIQEFETEKVKPLEERIEKAPEVEPVDENTEENENIEEVEGTADEVVFKAPLKPLVKSLSAPIPIKSVFPSNLFDTQGETQFEPEEEEDLDNHQLLQNLAKIHEEIRPINEPRNEIDFYENARFIQFESKFSQDSNPVREESTDTWQLPAHLIDILDRKYLKKVEKESEEDSGPLELFCDPIYGGLGEKYDQLRRRSPKLSSWTVYAKEMRTKKVFQPPKEFQNLKGEEIQTIEEDFLSQMPPVHLNKPQTFHLDSLPIEVQEIVDEFEEQEEYESSPDCSPIRLTLQRPLKTYKKGPNVCNRLDFDSDKVVISTDLEELEPVEMTLDVQIHCSATPSDLDFSKDSNIFVELDGLTQSLKRTCEEASMETSLASPEESLVKPFEFRDDCSLESSPKSGYGTPRSQKSIHLSDFGSQEILNDDDLLVEKTSTVATSPIKFDSYCDQPNDLNVPTAEIPAPPKNFFNGFDLASGRNIVTETNKAANFFSDIFEEFPLDPVAVPVRFGCFQPPKMKVPGTSWSDQPGPSSSNQELAEGVEMSLKSHSSLTPSMNPFTGFGLASGKKIVTQTSKAANLFSDIFEEFPLDSVAPTMNYGGFQTTTITSPSTKLPDTKPLNEFSTVSLPQPTKICAIPIELQNTSFEDDLSVDVLNHISNVEKSALQKSIMQKTSLSPLRAVENLPEIVLRPKRVDELRSPLVRSSPVIESPEGFMSGLINRDTSAASTPLNQRGSTVHSRTMNVRRTKLLNRMSEVVTSPSKAVSRPTELEVSSYNEAMTTDMKEILKQSYLEQDRMIESKTADMKKPTPGSLIVRKGQENRLKWKDFVRKEIVKKEMQYKSVTMALEVTQAEITYSNAKNFRFNLLQFCSKSDLESNKMGFDVSPTIRLIPDKSYRTGFGEFLKTFRTLPGVDQSLFTPKWFQHHYKMIVFKLYRYTKRAKVPSGVILTPENIIDQLKYRYDREIDKVRRSPIRRCVEGDDVPGKRLVLEVVDIQGNNITLSDGWYAIKAEIDEALRGKVTQGKIAIGKKVITTGAEIRNLDNPCHPIDMPDNIRLKIYYNSTRPAPLEAKLGYQPNPFPLLIHLNDVQLHGGLVSSLLVYVARVYPPIFHDRNAKEYYNEHQERRLHSKWEIERQAHANKILEETTDEVRREFKEQQKLNSSPNTMRIQKARRHLEEDGDTWDITETEHRLIGNENDKINDEIVRRCMDRSRGIAWQVSLCLRIRVLDVRHPQKSVIITLWNAKEIYNPYIKENLVFRITNLSPNVNDGDLRLFSSSNTDVKAIKMNIDQTTDCSKRNVTEIEDIPALLENPPPFDEVDIFGLVVSIQKKDKVHIVFLSNSKADMVSVNFCASLEESGYADIVKEGTFLSVKNLQWRLVGSNTPIPTLFVKNLFTKITSLSGRKVTKDQKVHMDSFNGIDLNSFTEELTEKLGTELNVVKINESLGETTRPEWGEASINKSSDNSLGTNKRKRLGSSMHMSAKKRVCTRSQKNS